MHCSECRGKVTFVAEMVVVTASVLMLGVDRLVSGLDDWRHSAATGFVALQLVSHILVLDLGRPSEGEADSLKLDVGTSVSRRGSVALNLMMCDLRSMRGRRMWWASSLPARVSAPEPSCCLAPRLLS